MTAARLDPAWPFAHCEALVREGDRDRFFATLFAPADKRPHLFALYAFNLEIARIRDSISEPALGEIRLQWWRDTLQGEARGNVRGNPVAAALDDAIVRFRLPRQALVDLSTPAPSISTTTRCRRSTISRAIAARPPRP